jgi:hypothetical protein
LALVAAGELVASTATLAMTTPASASGFECLMKSYLPPEDFRPSTGVPAVDLLAHRGASLTDAKTFCQPFSKTITMV